MAEILCSEAFKNFSLLQSLVGGLIALSVVWVGSLLTGRRAHKDRIWQRKVEAYGQILEALNVMMWSYDDDQRDIENSVQRTLDYHKKRRDDYNLWERKFFSTVAREVWLLPLSVKAETDRLAKALDMRLGNDNDYVDSCASEIQKSIKQVEALARVDLKRMALFGLWIQ